MDASQLWRPGLFQGRPDNNDKGQATLYSYQMAPLKRWNGGAKQHVLQTPNNKFPEAYCLIILCTCFTSALACHFRAYAKSRSCLYTECLTLALRVPIPGKGRLRFHVSMACSFLCLVSWFLALCGVLASTPECIAFLTQVWFTSGSQVHAEASRQFWWLEVPWRSARMPPGEFTRGH